MHTLRLQKSFFKCRASYVLILFITFVIFILSFRQTDKSQRCQSFEDMVLRKVKMDDECLVQYIRDSRLFFPSNSSYNLTTRIEDFKPSFKGTSPVQSFANDRDSPWIEALIAVEKFVPKKGQRYFFECGALDGITYSTTLHLERFLNWTGLLIEADERFYNDMKNVHRKAFGIHACVSQEDHPSKALFEPSPIYLSRSHQGGNVTVVNPGIGYIPNNVREGHNLIRQNLHQIQCLPVYSMLLAVNMTRIDLFILDVEGVEMDVLATIPFGKVDIGVLMIEIYGKSEKIRKKLHEFLYSKGYTFYDTFKGGMHPGDDIFINRKYLKSDNQLMTLKKINIKDIFKIITGENSENFPENDLVNFQTLFLPLLAR